MTILEKIQIHLTSSKKLREECTALQNAMIEQDYDYPEGRRFYQRQISPRLEVLKRRLNVRG